MPEQNRTEPGADLFSKHAPRWILVVTLGCSLGLLLVYGVVNTRHYSARPRGLQAIHNNIAPAPAAVPRFSISEETVDRELRRVIESQLSAFRKDDYPAAYAFAATSLRSQIPLPAFERMVKKTYPEIAQSDSVRFGVMLDNGELALVRLTIIGATGRSLHYEYAMQRERFGWRIAGVAAVKAGGVTL